MRIRAKLILSNIIVVAFSVLVVSLPVLFLQTRELKSNIEQSAIQNMAIASGDISAFLKKSKVIINDMASYLQANAGEAGKGFSVVASSQESNKSFYDVNTMISRTDDLVRQIHAAMEEQQEGSKQIVESLKIMNDNTTEVRTASHEMAEGNRLILDEVHNLQDTTLVIKQSMKEMSIGAREMNGTSSALSEISSKVRDSIKIIGSEIDQFKV